MKAIKRLRELNEYQEYNTLDVSRLHDEFESWKYKRKKETIVKALDSVILCLERGEKFFGGCFRVVDLVSSVG
jgi:hypothetical protein